MDQSAVLSKVTDAELLDDKQLAIIHEQIRKNSGAINDHVSRIDLFVNMEGHSRRAPFVVRLRKRMFLLMDENDTFRRVLWKHLQAENLNHLRVRAPGPAQEDAVSG